jgi:hypothetical protein
MVTEGTLVTWHGEDNINEIIRYGRDQVANVLRSGTLRVAQVYGDQSQYAAVHAAAGIIGGTICVRMSDLQPVNS